MNLEKPKKESKKKQRIFQVLMGLVELYLESGKPIGSNTLKENGFPGLSSATIRNYFAKLENQGYLRQPHSSGGRIPTHKALKWYAEENYEGVLRPSAEEIFSDLAKTESRNLVSFLQMAADRLSAHTEYAVFLTSVRFDHDLVLQIKIVPIDQERTLCILITDFGQIITEVFSFPHRFSTFAFKRIEAYLQWRIKGGETPQHLEKEEYEAAQSLYNELMVRYLVRYSNFSSDDIYRTGFSRLLLYPEFHDPVAVAASLSLFENTADMHKLLKASEGETDLSFWIGNDLAPYLKGSVNCSIITMPYFIGQARAGFIGILGPSRMPYKTLFGELRFFSNCVSKSLTKSLLKFKLSFRQPSSGSLYLQLEERKFVDQKLLESKE